MIRSRFWVFIFIICFLIIPFSVNAQTIRDYKNKIAKIQAEKSELEANSADLQSKIDKAHARINEITNTIVSVQKEQTRTRDEIEDLNVKIKAKNEEMKDLISFYQISDNDNFYLKFIFGADSFEDLIFRFSVAEQLTKANDDLVKEMDILVGENKKKINELKQEEVRLNNLDKQMAEEIESLGEKKRSMREDVLSADEEIAALEKQIAFFKKEGCSDNQDVTTCSLNIPSASGFVLPTTTGVIDNDGMSEYGYRWHPVWRDYRFHDGIDITASCGVPVKAASNGKVIFAGNIGNGFGNYVMIAHNVGGSTKTSLYGHLSSYIVSESKHVSRGEVIGYVGTTGTSTGCHLHFQTMYGSGYGSTFNPRELVNFPATGTYW